MLEKKSGAGADDVFFPAILKRLSWLQSFVTNLSTKSKFSPSLVSYALCDSSKWASVYVINVLQVFQANFLA